MLFSIVAVPIYIPTNSTEGFPFLHILSRICCVFYSSHSHQCKVIPLCSFDLHLTISNVAEHRRIDAFELWCWRRLLSVPWTARRSNKSILKEISPGETPILWPSDAKS